LKRWCGDSLHALPAEGTKAEKAYKESGALPDPSSTDNPEFKIVLAIIRDGLPKDPTKWTRMGERMVGTFLLTVTSFVPLMLGLLQA
jgi:hypothetical protein